MAATSTEVPFIEATLVVQVPAELGEGSIWDQRSKRLLWLDIPASKIYRFDPETGTNEEHDLSSHSKSVSSVVPLAVEIDPTGNKVGVTLFEGFALYDLETKAVTVLPGNPALGEREKFNDGKVDPAGRYWAGTIARDTTGMPVHKGSLYRRNADGSVTRMREAIAVSNGLSWNKDASTMYYTDSMTGIIDAYDFDNSTGEVKNQRPCVEGFDFATTGVADGHAIDSEGMLWVARFNGGCAGRYDPSTGKLLAEVRVPAAAGREVTSVAFGGEGLGDLYITTAHEFKTAEQAAAEGFPLAGCLFRVKREDLVKLGAAPGQPVNMLRCSL